MGEGELRAEVGLFGLGSGRWRDDQCLSAPTLGGQSLVMAMDSGESRGDLGLAAALPRAGLPSMFLLRSRTWVQGYRVQERGGCANGP